jgi:protein-S-isoprenylcysteine O-methyltransferase Ste14
MGEDMLSRAKVQVTKVMSWQMPFGNLSLAGIRACVGTPFKPGVGLSGFPALVCHNGVQFRRRTPVRLLYHSLFPAMWFFYITYWWTQSRNVKPAAKSEPSARRTERLVLLLSATAFLCVPKFPVQVLNARFLPESLWWFWASVIVALVGFAFSIWARRYLGSNWSQEVTVKQDHELITSGPYAVVRHPIYTGLLLAFLGTAMSRGEWCGLIGLALLLIALWRKLRLEEHWMRTEFGDSYQNYCRRVRSLIPFVA